MEMAVEEPDPAKKEDFVGLADWLGQGGSLTEMRDRKQACEAWQRIVAALASRNTIDAVIRERMERRFGR
jgi:predicted secreted protein